MRSTRLIARLDVKGANLIKADLRNSNLTGARLDYANLSGARLNANGLRGAFVCDTILPDGTVANPDCNPFAFAGAVVVPDTTS